MPSDDNQRSGGLARLRAARGPLPRDEVDDFQHARIVSAMIEVASELGYLGAAVAPVVARAGVSRRTFYELFDGREDCFLAAFEWGVGQVRAATLEAYGSQRAWRERVRHALAALLLLLDSEPELARVCVIEALGAGKLVLQRRAEIMDELVGALDVDAPHPRAASGERPLLTAEGIVGGAFSVVHGRLLEQQIAHSMPGALIGLHGQLMALIVLPYLGPRTAGEEFTRPTPEPPPREVVRGAGEGGRLLERLDMRLTYRTVRCLVFIGEHPGTSNREIARGAEISDEGQASKLLGRLTRLGLIVNSRPPGPGFPNRWTLTAHGEQVLGAVRGR
jgi:AcrR family transcriptional regulator/DNA-binding MarR family transcriptional regulator